MGESNLKIALTGAMGAGKSYVAELFRQLGSRVVDADEISRRLLEPSARGWSALADEFGKRFFKIDLTVDRKKLRTAIFSDEDLRKKINSILHPLVKQAINEICEENVDSNSDATDAVGRSALTVVEVPLLFEVGWQGDFDLVIVVVAAEETCLNRIMSRDEVDRHSALAAFAAQMSLAEKARMADHVIDNSGDLESTARQVKELYFSLSS
ncbi:MAG: dephospho-CoA kinase [Desulfobulbaceae bacterium]|nr:dephospho-CoA kinase [Desulfobulbaceae bacterium]